MNGFDSYRRFVNGDKNALIDIIDGYKAPLTYYVFSIVGDYQTAEELCEDTFVKLVIKKPRYSEEKSFKAWLFTMARNITLDYLRKAKQTVPLEIVSDTPSDLSVEDGYFATEKQQAVRKALEKLNPSYREAIYLTYFEGLSNKELSKCLKKSLHSCEMLLSRARASLKKQLESEGITYED